MKYFLNNPIHYNKFQEEVDVIVVNKMIGRKKLTVKDKVPQCGGRKKKSEGQYFLPTS